MDIFQPSSIRKPLYVILTLNILAFIFYCYSFYNNKYLPSPFFYDASDTFMDFFNPLASLNRENIYENYASIYPPLNFILIKIIHYLVHGSNAVSPFSLRQSSSYIYFFPLIILVISPILSLKNFFHQFNLTDKILLFFIFILSYPFLFLIERGNLLFLTFIPIVMFFTSESPKRELWLAILINLKPYFLFLSLAYLLKKEWKLFLRLGFITGSIFVITGLIIDPQNFLLFFKNILSFSRSHEIVSGRGAFALPATLDFFSYIAANKAIQLSGFLGSALHYFIAPYLVATKFFISVIFLIVLIISSKKMSFLHILLALMIFMLNWSIALGGYTLIFYFFVFPLFTNLHFRKVYFICISLFTFPWIFTPSLYTEIFHNSVFVFLSRSYISNIKYSIYLGSLFLPLVNFFIFLTFIIEMWLCRKDLNLSK